MAIERPEGWMPKDATEAQGYINDHVRDGGGDPHMLEYCHKVVETKDVKTTPFRGSPPVGPDRPRPKE